MTTMTDPLAWQTTGLCRGVTTNIFFPDDFELPDPAAQRLCRRCPAREACLQYALEHEEFGIWGGTTDDQREAMRRTRHRVKCPDCLSHEVAEVMPHHEICLSCGLSWNI